MMIYLDRKILFGEFVKFLVKLGTPEKSVRITFDFAFRYLKIGDIKKYEKIKVLKSIEFYEYSIFYRNLHFFLISIFLNKRINKADVFGYDSLKFMCFVCDEEILFY